MMRIPALAVLLALWMMWPSWVGGQAVEGAGQALGASRSRIGSAPAQGVRWALGAGWVRMGISDALASPLRHRGSGFGASIERRGESRSTSWTLELSAASVTVESDIATEVGGFEDTFGAGLDFRYLRRVGTLAGDRIGFLAGASLLAWATVREHHYTGLVPEDFADLLAPLQLSGAWETRLGSGHLRHTLSVPLVAVVMRSPWSGLKFVPDVALAGPWQFTGVDSRLEVGPGRSGPIGVSFFWTARFFRYDKPLPLASATHRVGVRLEWDR